RVDAVRRTRQIVLRPRYGDLRQARQAHRGQTYLRLSHLRPSQQRRSEQRSEHENSVVDCYAPGKKMTFSNVVLVGRTCVTEVDALREKIVGLLPRLRRFARTLARNAHDADDIVQVAVERALGRLDQLRPGSELSSWLFG